MYVRQTGKTLQHRIKEHQRGFASYTLYTTSAVADHAMRTGHENLEAWNIRLQKNTMNQR